MKPVYVFVLNSYVVHSGSENPAYICDFFTDILQNVQRTFLRI